MAVRWKVVAVAVAVLGLAASSWALGLGARSAAEVDRLGGEVRAVDGPTELRSQAATVALGDGTVLVWGGRSVSTDSGHVYDPDSGSWERLPAAPGPPRSGAAAVWTGTEAVIWGGASSTSPVVEDAGGIAWNPDTGTWRELPPAPHGLLDARGVAFGGGLLFTGGRRPHTAVPADLWFDLADETWTEVPTPAAVHNVVRHGDRLFATGPGVGDRSRRRWAVLTFDPEVLRWEQGAPPLDARWAALAPGLDGEDVPTALVVPEEGADLEARVLEPDGWQRIASAPGVPPVTIVEPVGYPPAALWTGSLFVLDGTDGLVVWDPHERAFAAVRDERIRTFGGTVVWTGSEVVSLTNQNTEGWVWTPPTD